MSSHEMPFLVFNLGVEMMFVLNSRLQAQAVPPDKAADVLSDIGTNIFSAAFVAELLTPQPMYSAASVLQVFTALSNSTVMRLSENSMRKLYDLVFMTVKYQVLTLRHPLELLELTLNHLEAVGRILPPSVQPLASAAADLILRLAATLHTGDWATIRRSLLNFFGSRHVRVSVFVERHVQDSETGAFVIPRDVFLSPSPACAPPGLVYVAGVSEPGTFPHPDAHLPYPPHIPVGSWRPRTASPRMTSNGFDMYAAAAAKLSSGSSAAAAAAGDALARQAREMPAPRVSAVATTSPACGGAVPAPHEATVEGQQCAYDAEASYLARLIGSASRARGVQQFELELFHNDSGSGGGAAGVGAASAPPAPPVIAVAAPVAVPVTRMSAAAVQEQNRRLLGIMDAFDVPAVPGSSAPAPAAGGRGASDLLDIMDEL
ncbi:Organic solute transport protein 1 [Novymonas esmeraldas]|uniref:Organic solute transport protein 1 n=1 Tax=Novymonas esmeraldas TaxID=1808958 RepID=A0AAW0ESU7_9TRYP